MTRLLSFALVLALLSACATTPEEKRAYAEREATRLKQTHGQTCENLGYQPDTDRWRDCLLELESQRLMQQMMDRSYWYYPDYPFFYAPFCRHVGGRLVCR